MHVFTLHVYCTCTCTSINWALLFSTYAQDRSANFAATEFTLTVHKMARLPIRDFMPRDYGQPGQEFGFEVGPICFS